MNLNAVVTAGGRVDAEFAQIIGTPVKALAHINGTTMLSRTIAALRETGIERIAVIGGQDVRDACADTVDNVLAEFPTGVENIRAALHAWDSAVPLLYATSDMPFITASAVGDFVNAAPPDTVALPLTEWPDFAARFPGSPPFGVRVGSEKIVNGGLFMIPKGAVSTIEAFALRFFDARKSLWRMAALAGPTILTRFLTGSLSVAHVESRASRVLGIPARTVRHAPPELAYDIDVLAEYTYAVEYAVEHDAR
ncbi:MAG TPA: NTP transferase domain-containing protein [Candidatus Baltobacteraceae bacterium]|jgi:GTP:adenosylcobinamide-phosphate guanylyltransferase|nr:NTP transferase domain-containing protein [Candidatus Baltobacteraceae bacterium]